MKENIERQRLLSKRETDGLTPAEADRLHELTLLMRERYPRVTEADMERLRELERTIRNASEAMGKP